MIFILSQELQGDFLGALKTLGWFFKGSKSFGMTFLGVLRALGWFFGGSEVIS